MRIVTVFPMATTFAFDSRMISTFLMMLSIRQVALGAGFLERLEVVLAVDVGELLAFGDQFLESLFGDLECIVHGSLLLGS
jgi:hypothetical protein